ncbi:hypothetical protein ONZ51_g9590 [Trametes cubensis]|uniref:Gelsolin n=1 Tax=Trametes cubensis TaxID=1111947 RepID=A0AAD7TL43_9APHY|nr:hypothetical protein ONZ51_g9590 [Trametes cubensis]
MDVPRPASAARRSTLNIPPKPDASLAEWTSKIKELQKQVDEDEEAETRRLEAEIAASRQARLRRSTGYTSRSSSVDLSQSASPLKAEDRSHTADSILSTTDRQRNQDDALRKLMGESTSPKPTTPTPPSIPATQPKRPAEPMSLAAFIGGRATGPRLTKHAPQQDAHDPTQFEQRTHISAPHPVFGRGGVAMPGMTGNGSVSVVSRAIREQESQPASPTNGQQTRDRRISTPSSVRAAVEKAEERKVLPSYTGSSSYTATRQRTISTPTGAAPARASPSAETFLAKPKPDPISRPLSHSPHPAIRPITPHGPSSSPAPSKSPAPRPLSAAAYTPHTPPPPSPTRSPKPPSQAPGLARPIQPSPRPSFGSPQMPPSHNPSPAFLKPPPAKEPTPSLSRLQGRGFVQNMVKKTSELAVISPESSPTPDRKDPTGKRQSSVLDRWQFSNATGSPPVISPKPMPLRKSFTVDPGSPTTSTYSAPLKSDNTGRTLKSKSSLPSLSTMRTGDSVAGPSSMSESGAGPRGLLGSSKTVITYIQPAKTGDPPIPQPPRSEVSAAPDVDELGMRVRTRTTSSGLVQERGAAGLPPSSGQPLSHPTKDRAKKPRKGKSAPAASASKLAAIREASPVREELVPSKPEHKAPSLNVPDSSSTGKTTFPLSQYPSPPSSQGRAISPARKPAVPSKPSLDVYAPPATTPGKTSPVSPLAPPQPARSPSITPPQTSAQKVPASPAKHTRIPSTGNRATVMDVAQVFQEVLQSTSPVSTSPIETKRPSPPPAAEVQVPSASEATPKDKDEEEESWEPPSVKNMIANWGPRSNGAPAALSAPALERRKSSYEKYSAFVMPPLAEEKTPVPSPAGTLARGTAPISVDVNETEVTKDEEKAETKEMEKAHDVTVAIEAVEVKADTRPELIHLAFNDEPLPHVDLDALYRAPRLLYTPDADLNTVSVDVLSIAGNTATTITKDANVFYDAEFLAVVHRAKARSSGLVQTKVWGWQGRRAQIGEREAQKLQELARRYGTTPMMVHQFREPAEFVFVLGGQLAIRQGTRTHWSADNTAMHVVRSLHGLIFIDELDLGIKHLCSGYSYCISILDTYYVWHGRGSIPAEQQAALKYAQTLASSSEHVVEMGEDESQADEMFWMILGEGDYAKADYWQWRTSASTTLNPRAWVVDAKQGTEAVKPISAFPAQQQFNNAVYLVDCVWELYVLVGSEARGRRLEIRLALSIAGALAQKASSERPFTPPVHVLVFPTQIPTDLLLTFRELDESELNGGDIPEHMNLIPAGDALTDLNSTRWTTVALRDHTMLPLGVTPSALS